MGKQVKTPRFYVDMVTFLHATGQLGWDGDKGGAELLYMNCANPYMRETEDSVIFTIGSSSENTPKTSIPINFCALLNHNFASEPQNIHIGGYEGLLENEQNPRLHSADGFANIINSMGSGGYTDGLQPEFNGTSIFQFTEMNEYWRGFFVKAQGGIENTDLNHQLGSFVVGKYFDCPNSPDLNLTMSRRFDGIKRQKTVGGKTLANIYYDGPTEWTMNNADGTTYKYPPFELDLPTTDGGTELGFNMRAKSGLGRKGLRSWNLTFSYISEDDMWISYENSSISPFAPDQTGFDATTNTDVPLDNGNSVASNPNPMLSDNSFNFVWNCTLGGTLPFIFQPDNTNNNSDQFSICTFRENTLDVTQVASNVYNLSITIDEVA